MSSNPLRIFAFFAVGSSCDGRGMIWRVVDDGGVVGGIAGEGWSTGGKLRGNDGMGGCNGWKAARGDWKAMSFAGERGCNVWEAMCKVWMRACRSWMATDIAWERWSNDWKAERRVWIAMNIAWGRWSRAWKVVCNAWKAACSDGMRRESGVYDERGKSVGGVEIARGGDGWRGAGVEVAVGGRVLFVKKNTNLESN